MLVNVDVSNETHVQFLYQLLCERYETDNINIEGRSLTSRPEFKDYREHLTRTVDKYHYIWCESELLKAYIFMRGTDREIGIFVPRKYWGQGIGDTALTALSTVVECPLTAIIHPDNINSQNLLHKHGFEIVGTLWRKTS